MLTRTTRVLAVLLVALLLLALGGCGENPGAAKATEGLTEKTDTETLGTEQSETEPVETEPPEPLPILPLDDSQMEDPAARVIDRAPTEGREGLTIETDTDEPQALNYVGRGVSDLYPNASRFNSFGYTLFSYEKLNLDSFLLRTATCSAMEQQVRAWTPEYAPQLDPAAQPEALPYHVYASWRGMDWKELARLELAVRQCPEDDAALRARDACRDRFLEDFLALKAEDLPPVPYLYEFELRFPPDAEGGEVLDEAITDLAATADYLEKPFTGFGCDYALLTRLHAEDPRSRETPGMQLTQPGYEVLAAPLNDGDCSCLAMEFIAAEDITLHRLRLYRSQLQLQQIRVTRTGAGATAEETWDGESELTVRAGERVALWLRLHDPEGENHVDVFGPDGVIYSHNLKNAKSQDYVSCYNSSFGAYRIDQFCLLDYTANGAAHSASTELVLRRDLNPWELIFLCACDQDHRFSKNLYSYYLDYYNPLFNSAWKA
ncbi:MAG: hypothetical protein IKS05_11020 [Oscillospiraceae bacterium]|nr:hypothetical protein [Oscillospiraceae bacterium]